MALLVLDPSTVYDALLISKLVIVTNFIGIHVWNVPLHYDPVPGLKVHFPAYSNKG